VRTPVVVALAFVLGVAGVLAGHALRSQFGRRVQSEHAPPAVETVFQEGDPFPAVELVDEAGRRLVSTELLDPEGGVILFLTLQCPPCVDAAIRWQGFIDQGLLPASRVIVVTVDPPDAIAAFRAEHGIAFAILQDRRHRFMTEYKVNRFPLEVTVDGSGVVQEIGRDLAPPGAFSARMQ
jgi:peroxiredoxin